jgi:arylsulfatase A-like enzyme/predicted Zn-dependent protease
MGEVVAQESAAGPSEAPRRRSPIPIVGLLSMLELVVVMAAVACSPGSPAGPRPDAGRSPSHADSVLLITLDTTRADRIGAYGARDVETPALDALAAGGVIFGQAWAVAPITAPSHATLFTGLYPPRHGVRDNAVHYLADERSTVAEHLAAAGFRTAAFVSAMVLERRFGFDQGFEVYDDDLAASGARRQSRMMIERPADVTVARALEWLDDLGDDERYFLWVHLFDPHAPYAPPPPWADRFADRLYDGEVAAMDDAIGRLLRHPRAAAPDTLVVAVGDHGESLGEHGEQTHGFLVYEATLRVPWIMRLPRGPAGLRIDIPVSQVDLVPTLLEALAVPLEVGRDEAIEGRSLLPLLSGARDVPARTLFAESEAPFLSYGWSPLRAARRGAIKLVDAPTVELYDLDRDPGELEDLAAARPGDVDRLAGELEAWSAAGAVSASRAPVDGRTADQLRALGYTAGEDARPRDQARGNPLQLIGVHDELQAIGELLESARFGAAEEGLRDILVRDPDNVSALQELTRALVGLGRLDEAAETAARARRLTPWSARVPLVEAEVAFRRGDLQSALAQADESLNLDPRYQEARLERSRYLALLGRDEEAVAELERLRELSSNSPWVDLRFVELVELPAGRLGPAETRLRSVVARDPYLVDAWAALGTVLQRQGRSRDAASAYRSGLEHRPDADELQARLALLLAEAADPGAEDALHTAISSSPLPRPDLHLALADRLQARGAAADARRELELAAQASALTPASRNDRAMALARLGRQDEAEAVLLTVVREEPQFARAWHNLASLAVQRGRWREAERCARTALDRDPELSIAWNNLGIALEELGKPADAEAAYRRAIAADGGDLKALFNLGLLLRTNARYDEAAVVQEQVLERAPAHAGAHFELGALYAGPLADFERAEQHLRATIAAAPDHPRARQARAILEQLP